MRRSAGQVALPPNNIFQDVVKCGIVLESARFGYGICPCVFVVVLYKQCFSVLYAARIDGFLSGILR